MTIHQIIHYILEAGIILEDPVYKSVAHYGDSEVKRTELVLV